MKRSRMLLAIEEILVEFPEEIESSKAAEIILSRLERAGMNPPTFTTLTKTGKKRVKNGWEVEDE